MENAIVTKSFQFAVRIVKLCRYLRTEKKEYTLSDQLLRASDYLTEAEFSSVYADCKELERLLTSIVKSAKTKSKA